MFSNGNTAIEGRVGKASATGADAGGWAAVVVGLRDEARNTPPAATTATSAAMTIGVGLRAYFAGGRARRRRQLRGPPERESQRP